MRVRTQCSASKFVALSALTVCKMFLKISDRNPSCITGYPLLGLWRIIVEACQLSMAEASDFPQARPQKWPPSLSGLMLRCDLKNQQNRSGKKYCKTTPLLPWFDMNSVDRCFWKECVHLVPIIPVLRIPIDRMRTYHRFFFRLWEQKTPWSYL